MSKTDQVGHTFRHLHMKNKGGFGWIILIDLVLVLTLLQKAAGPSEDPSNQQLHDAMATWDEGTYAWDTQIEMNFIIKNTLKHLANISRKPRDGSLMGLC